ncbi:MAG: glutamyl-tRNA reductase, partial [Candidatus Brocadiia bacterium]|jgi:glutamyl-tRNA reductase|nr:glutamyl-tRNA reductase [Candidatus Brocadiia bacterium]
VDLVICSTGAPDFVLRCEPLTGGLARRDRPLLIIDIAVPRDVEPRLGELPDVFLYNIDHLDRLVAENIDRRRREIPRAEAIVEWETRQFARWLDSLQVAPTIKLLQRRFDLLRVEQIKRYGKNFGPAGGEQLEKFAGGLLGKVLHSPMAFLRELSADGSSTDGLVAVDLVRRIFDLDSLEPEE